jgi:hypothetical protein
VNEISDYGLAGKETELSHRCAVKAMCFLNVPGAAHFEPLHEREEQPTDGQNHNRNVSPLRAIYHGIILVFGYCAITAAYECWL